MDVARIGARRASAAAAFSVAVAPDPKGYRVQVRGELDIAGAPRLRKELGRLNGWNVVLDLSEVTFIDSTGLRVLLWAARRAGEGHFEISLRCSPAVTRTLSLSGVGEDLRQKMSFLPH